MKQITITPQFVELMPNQIEEGVLYVSEKYGTAIHKCCCGCGSEVVTPLSPAKWKLFREGNTVTLHPSIGNWNFKCNSHYWIRKNRVQWAPSMSSQQIQLVQENDKRDMERHIAQSNTRKIGNTIEQPTTELITEAAASRSGLTVLWRWLKSWWSR